MPQMLDDGLYSYEETSNSKENNDVRWIRISGHFDTPARVSDPKTGASYGLWVEFNDERGRLKRTVIPSTMFHSSARDICARLSDLGLYINRNCYDIVATYLQEQMELAPSADVSPATGWLTPTVYILPDQVFGTHEDGRKVYFSGDLQQHHYRTSGSLDQWQDRIARLCVGNSRLITVVSMALAGPLMADLNENSGGLHFWGRTTAGKSTALVVGASVCGGGVPLTGFTSSWRTTANGLEPLLACHNDGTIFLDEIGQADPKAVSELIYSAANNTGKHRMTRTLVAAPRLHWRALICSTGEHTVVSYVQSAGIRLPGGAAIRLIDVTADAGAGLGVFEELHGRKSAGQFADELRAAALKYYGVPYREFLTILSAYPPEQRQEMITLHTQDFLAECNVVGACPEVVRAANRMAVIAAAGELASEWNILPWPSGTANKGVAKCFHEWRQARGEDGVGHDDGAAVSQVRGFLERYSESKFEAIEKKSANRLGSSRMVDRAGWRRRCPDGSGLIEFLIQPEYFKSEICKGFEYTAVASALLKAGFLRRQGKHWTIRTRLPGETNNRDLFCILSSIQSGSESDPEG